MRGEGNIQRMFGRSEGTPNTPSTASTIRSHPPNYQRMHSNESGKSSDKDISGSGNGRLSD